MALNLSKCCGLALALCAAMHASHALDAGVISDSELAAKGKASTVMLALKNEQAFGSAFCIDERGFYLTNCHVIKDAGHAVTLIVAAGEKEQHKYSAEVIRQDEELDLALLKIDSQESYPALPYGSDDSLTETAEVITFGFPFGKELALNPGEYPSISVNKGRVSSLRKKDGVLNRIQIDAVVNPGNSGGPLLDKKGEVVGVVVSGIIGAGAVNFAIPVAHIRKFLSKPTISFTPPTLTPNSLSEPVDFKATLAPSPFVKETYDLELVITGGDQLEQHVEMKMNAGVYTARAVPLALKKAREFAVTAVFPNGRISGLTDNLEFLLNAVPLKLSEVVSIKLGTAGWHSTVTLGNGKILKGLLHKLDSLPVRLGNQTLNVDISKAAEITVANNDAPVALTFTVVAKSSGKELCRACTAYSANGGNTVGTVDDALEPLLSGAFIKPDLSVTRTSYLKVLSTSGDFIGQGKRYDYAAKNIIFKPSDGLIEISVDNWHLELSPGKGQIFKAEEYLNAKRYPFNDTMPGLDFSGNGRGSNAVVGKFVVWEWVIQNGIVTSFAVDFIQHSENIQAAPLVGKLRYNSLLK